MRLFIYLSLMKNYLWWTPCGFLSSLHTFYGGCNARILQNVQNIF